MQHLSMTENDASRLLGAVELAFDKTWLESRHPPHQLKSAWQRTDALATTELVTLGDAVSIFRRRDPDWLSQRVRDIKKNASNCHGYLFELLGAAMIARAGAKIYPTHKNAPGIDAVVQFDDGFRVHLSFKNHDISSHEREFQTHCSKARAKLHSRLRNSASSVIVFIDAPSFLTGASWDAINRHIEAVPVTGPMVPSKTKLPDGFIVSGALTPASGGERFSKAHLSDTFFALCGWHRNEQENLKNKLSSALANLAKHAVRSDESANVVLVRLNKTADLDLLAAHAREALDESAASAIDGVILYQAAVTRSAGVSQVSHHMKTVLRRGYDDRAHVIPFCVLIGVISPHASHLELRSANGESRRVDEKYLFQEGDHYYVVPAIEQSPSFTLSSVAPGVRTHAVVGDEFAGFTISGIFPPSDDLLLL
jgi:hypothetical protein